MLAAAASNCQFDLPTNFAHCWPFGGAGNERNSAINQPPGCRLYLAGGRAGGRWASRPRAPATGGRETREPAD